VPGEGGPHAGWDIGGQRTKLGIARHIGRAADHVIGSAIGKVSSEAGRIYAPGISISAHESSRCIERNIPAEGSAVPPLIIRETFDRHAHTLGADVRRIRRGAYF